MGLNNTVAALGVLYVRGYKFKIGQWFDMIKAFMLTLGKKHFLVTCINNGK